MGKCFPIHTNTRIRLGFRSLIRVGGSGKEAATGGRVEAVTAVTGTRTLMICPLFSAITRFNYFYRRMARGLELYACHCGKALQKSTGTQVSQLSYLLKPSPLDPYLLHFHILRERIWKCYALILLLVVVMMILSRMKVRKELCSRKHIFYLKKGSWLAYLNRVVELIQAQGRATKQLSLADLELKLLKVKNECADQRRLIMELHSAIHSLREDNRRLWRHSTSTAPTPNLEFPGKTWW